MLKKITISVLVAGLLGGCFVRTNGPYARGRGCGPAYHWQNGYCVHNGNGRGNGKSNGGVVVRDHRR